MNLKMVGTSHEARSISALTDVRHADDADLALEELRDRTEEAPVDGEQRVAEGLVCAGKLVLPRILAEVEYHAAGERKAVRLKSAGREADDHVSRADRLAGDEL